MALQTSMQVELGIFGGTARAVQGVLWNETMHSAHCELKGRGKLAVRRNSAKLVTYCWPIDQTYSGGVDAWKGA